MKTTLWFSALSFALLIFFSDAAQADALFSLKSARPQRDDNCWSYGAAHMLEARAEYRDHISAMIDIEKSYHYYLIYDRLLNSFHRKMLNEAGNEPGDDMADGGGYSAELFDIFENHGFEFISVKASDARSGFDYPNAEAYPNTFQANANADGLKNRDLILNTEKELVKSHLGEAAAIQLIRTRLQQAYPLVNRLQTQTPWLNHAPISVRQSYARILGSDFRKGTHSPILITTTYRAKLPRKSWLRYDSGRYLGVAYHTPQEVLKLVRTSLDRGWPTTAESADHVMTALGYKTLGHGRFAYAISDSSGAYQAEGISWVTEAKMLKWFVDATVYYDAVKDLLPPKDTEKMGLPEVVIPRKH